MAKKEKKNDKKPIIDKSLWRTSKSQRKKYYLSDLARTSEGALVTSFMTMFLLMQGIDLTKMAGVMLVVKIIDSFDDVIFGFLIDRLKLDNLHGRLKKMAGTGRYLPWYRLVFWMFPLFTAMFYLMPVNVPQGVKLAWFFIFYLLYDLTYTLVEVPMNSLAVSITDNLEERNTIIQNRGILNNNVIMILGIILYALFSEKVGIPMKYCMVGASIVFFFCMIPVTKGVEEYNTELKNVDEDENAHYTFADMIECIKTNKYMFILLLSSVITSCLATGGTLANFVAYYHFGSSLVFAIPIAIAAVPGFIAQLNTAKIVKKFGKIRSIVVMGLLGGIPLLMIFFVGPGKETPRLILLCSLLAIQALPGNVSLLAKSFLIPDTIEFTRYKTGKDCSGIFFAMNSFVTKLTSSVAASFGLFLLGKAGWNNITATDFADIEAQGIAQPESALNMLWIVYALIPAIGTILGVLVMSLYKLRDNDIELMTKCNAGEITRRECEAQLSREYFDQEYYDKLEAGYFDVIDEKNEKENKKKTKVKEKPLDDEYDDDDEYYDDDDDEI